QCVRRASLRCVMSGLLSGRAEEGRFSLTVRMNARGLGGAMNALADSQYRPNAHHRPSTALVPSVDR
ncbi:hypothetical protein, partial [Burkholderia sp. E168m23]|uniref:hypothetical protein n=1 Tax=Burkholderia sp. E168m23 TaxID=1561200 RepID=UPI001F383669